MSQRPWGAWNSPGSEFPQFNCGSFPGRFNKESINICAVHKICASACVVSVCDADERCAGGCAVVVREGVPTKDAQGWWVLRHIRRDYLAACRMGAKEGKTHLICVFRNQLSLGDETGISWRDSWGSLGRGKGNGDEEDEGWCPDAQDAGAGEDKDNGDRAQTEAQRSSDEVKATESAIYSGVAKGYQKHSYFFFSAWHSILFLNWL
jgi:hypothetical protein